MSNPKSYEALKSLRAHPPLSSFDKFSSLSFRLFGGPAIKFAGRFPSLRNDLLKSNLHLTAEGMVAVAFFSTFVAYIVALGVVILALLDHAPLFLLILIAPPAVFVLTLNIPRFSQSNRSANLDNELPFMVGYLSILAGGGLSVLGILRKISEMKIFPASANEAKRVLLDVDLNGMDPISALHKAAKYSANKAFAELLTGYTTVLETGGDHLNYLNMKVKEAFDARSDKIKRTVESTGLLAEAYMIVVVVLGITLFTLYLLQTLIFSAGAGGGIQSVFAFAFLLVPIMSAVFCWLLDSTQPKWPYTDMRPYKIFLCFIPVGIVLFLIPLPIRLYLHLSIALIAMTIVPAVLQWKYSHERRTLEKMLPDFILDVSEGRKIGLPPEKSIERLADRDYGDLSKYVKRMGSQLSWGLPLNKVVSTFTAKVSSWITKVVGTLMIEVVEVGGGTVKGFSEMEAFTRKVSNIESDRRSQLRTYVALVYISGIMVITTTFVIIELLSQRSGFGGLSSLPTIQPNTIDLLLTASIFEGWVIGFVAGKMGESSIAEGFKHAAIMVVISLATILIAKSFISFPL